MIAITLARQAVCAVVPVSSLPIEPIREASVPIQFVTSAPVHLSYRLPSIEVYVEDRGPFRFLLDTRNRPSIVRPEFVAELGLEPDGLRVLLDISIGGAKLAPVSCDIREFGEHLPGSETTQGVLSLSSFHGHQVTVDFAREELRISAQSPEHEPDPDAIRYSWDPAGHPSIPVEIAGREMTVALDIWRSGDLMMPINVADDLPYADASVAIGHVRWQDDISLVTSARLQDSLRLAGHAVVGPGVMSSAGFPTPLIGQGILRAYAVTFDLQNELVSFGASNPRPDGPNGKSFVPLGHAPKDMVQDFDANRGKVRLLLLLSPT